MRVKSILIVVIALVVMLMPLAAAGCGGSEETTTTSAAAPETTTTTASESTTTSAPESTTTTIQAAAELLVFAAAGTKAPIDAAAAAFQEKYGTKLNINYGGGGEVLSAMVTAKQGDIFIAPEQRFMNSAKKQGAVDADAAPAPLAYMIPVIGVQKGNPMNIQTLADLGKSGTKVVMGNPETTLLGEVVPEMLEAAGVYDEVNANIVTNVPQVNAIITQVKAGQVDAGFIWHYCATTNAGDVDIIWIPKEYVTGIGEIQAAVSTFSKEPATAQLFIDFLTSDEGKAIFEQNGYIVDVEEAAQYWQGN